MANIKVMGVDTATGQQKFLEPSDTMNLPNNITTGSSPLKINNSTNLVDGLYQIAMARWNGGAFEFYEDAFFRFDHDLTGHFRVTAVGTAKSIGVYGFNSTSAGTSTFPIANDSDTWQGGYSSIAVGTFTQISSQSISVDYDDMQLFWIQSPNSAVKYRVTIMGGTSLGAIVERWNYSLLIVNTKITLPN
jgi:hypothetical protein